MLRFLVFACLICLIYSCGTLTQIKNTAIPIGTAFEKIDSILGKAQHRRIGDITKEAGEGLVSGINLDSIKVDKLVANVLHDLGPVLNHQLSRIELDTLQLKISSLIKKVITDKEIPAGIDSLLASIIQNVTKRPIKLRIDPVLNDEKLLRTVDTLLMTLLNEKNADGLSGMLNKTLLSISQSPGLDSILNKINKPLDKIEGERIGWKKNIKLLLGGIAGLILLSAAVYAWRKRTQYKALSALLTKNIDSISSREEYDQVVKSIQMQAADAKLKAVLDNLIKENKEHYLVKNKFTSNTENTIHAIHQILSQTPELKNKLLSHTEQNQELNDFIKEKITKS